MPTTGKDIARKLGLSQPTVSRVLSGSNKQIIADETRRRVENAAREMGYRPNILARSLRIRRTDTIGFYASPILQGDRLRLSGEFWTSMKRACDLRGFDLLIHTHKRDVPPEAIFEEIVGGRTDGALVFLDADSPLLRLIAQSPFPIVPIGSMLKGISASESRSDLDPVGPEVDWGEIMDRAVETLVRSMRPPREYRLTH